MTIIWRRYCALWLLLWCLQVAAVERPQCQTEGCIENSHTIDEFFYTINGTRLIVSFSEPEFYKMTCGPPLAHPAQPRFPRPAAFRKVVLVGCAPPTDLGAALAALGLRPTAVRRLELRATPAPPAPAALHSLPALAELALAAPAARPLRLEPGALPPTLLRLELRRVRPPPSLPPALRRLEMAGTGERRPPLAGLARLEFLSLAEDALAEAPPALGALSALRTLALDAPLAGPPALPPRLEELLLARVRLAGGGAWPACGALRALTLERNGLAELPPGWLAGCGALRRLRLLRQPALRPAADALRGAAELRQLHVLHCEGARLPAGLLAHTPLLEDLAIVSSDLDALPDGLLSPVAGSLRRLDLSANRLRAAALGAVPAAPLLAELRLGANPLGELCGPHARADSPLRRLAALRRLALSGGGLARLCRDWLALPALQHLDLTRNNFTDLQLGELSQAPGGAAGRRLTLDLSHNPLERVRADQDDYRRARDLPAPFLQVTVLTSGPLRCDCLMYWTWRALQLAAGPLQLRARCAAAGAPPTGRPAPPTDLLRPRALLLSPPPYPPPPAARPAPARPRAIADLAPEDFTCVVEEDLCGSECGCVAWPPLGVAAACGARLPALPQLAAARLTSLPDTLPPTLMLVDVRAAGPVSSGEELRRLAGGGRGVLLAGAALACGCGLLAAARDLRPRLLDADSAGARCRDGRALAAALAEPCADDGGARWPLAPAALLLLLLPPALVLLLRHDRLRLRLKAVLHRRGLHRWVSGGDGGGRPFDVFVCHCAADERWVRGRLLPPLEARGLRACVPARDWPPGAWLPAQLRLTLHASRQVLLVVSPDWAACAWARHEVRALGECGCRVVVVVRGGRVPALAPPPRAVLRADHPALVAAILRLVPPHPAPHPPHAPPAPPAPPAAA